MSRTSRLIDRRLAKALVLLQALMIPVSALIGWVVKDSTVALSAALGRSSAGLRVVIFHGNHFERQERGHLSRFFRTCIKA